MRGRKPAAVKTAPQDALTKAPRPPAWLSKSAAAEWKRVTAILVDRGVLTNGDLGALESYCTAVGTVRECQRALNTGGLFTVDASGVFKRHPAVTVQNAAMTTARQYAAELGLTPVSRSRPSMAEKRDDDDAADLDL